ncbi:hypothetical protein [Streptococcus suis]|uniref:hypothetical protein n=1 Tax=Streptococcus suis TaxID=1307 RepID=UPI003B9E2665
MKRSASEDGVKLVLFVGFEIAAPLALSIDGVAVESVSTKIPYPSPTLVTVAVVEVLRAKVITPSSSFSNNKRPIAWLLACKLLIMVARSAAVTSASPKMV